MFVSYDNMLQPCLFFYYYDRKNIEQREVL